MGRLSYVCTLCSEHFTRKTSGERHNLNLHLGGAEIVPIVEYLFGRSTGKYMSSHPSWFKHRRGRVTSINNQLVDPTVADSSMGTSKANKISRVADDSVTHASKFISSNNKLLDPPLPRLQQPYPEFVHGRPNIEDHATLKNKFKGNYIFPEFLPPDTMLSLLELEKLTFSTSDYHDNPLKIVQYAINECARGDQKYLRNKISQLHLLWNMKSR